MHDEKMNITKTLTQLSPFFLLALDRLFRLFEILKANREQKYKKIFFVLV
jgi:hypothetical protein